MKGIGRMCRMTWLILFIGIIAALTGTVSAYLADGEQIENRLTIGGNQIEIREEFDPPEELTPGSTFTKSVRVENSGHSECYVRVKAVFSDSNTGQHCSLDWNTTDFNYCAEDGFYYYRYKVMPKELTAYLFTTVTVSPEAPPEQLGEFSILVYAESCQAVGFATGDEAWAYFGRNKS